MATSLTSVLLLAGCAAPAGQSGPPSPTPGQAGPPSPTLPAAPSAAFEPTAVATAAATVAFVTPSPRPPSAPAPSATAALPPIGSVPASCTNASAIRVTAFVASQATSTSGADVCLVGWAAPPPIFDGGLPAIEPRWLWWSGQPIVVWDHSRGTLSDLECSQGKCPPYLLLYVQPGSRVAAVEGWVLVTGHVNDPAAATCHYVYPPDWTDSPQPDAQAVSQCNASFVITGITPTSAPS